MIVIGFNNLLPLPLVGWVGCYTHLQDSANCSPGQFWLKLGPFALPSLGRSASRRPWFPSLSGKGVPLGGRGKRFGISIRALAFPWHSTGAELPPGLLGLGRVWRCWQMAPAPARPLWSPNLPARAGTRPSRPPGCHGTPCISGFPGPLALRRGTGLQSGGAARKRPAPGRRTQGAARPGLDRRPSGISPPMRIHCQASMEKARGWVGGNIKATKLFRRQICLRQPQLM